jgi:hypothetical protein
LAAVATNPRKLGSRAIKKMIDRALWKQGVRKPVVGVRRYEFKTTHGFRKFFKTHAQQVMVEANVEYMMGHVGGMGEYYHKPDERLLLADYLKAVDVLTINNNSEQRQQREVELKIKDNQRDEQIAVLENKIKSFKQDMREMYDQMDAIMKWKSKVNINDAKEKIKDDEIIETEIDLRRAKPSIHTEIM